MNPTVEAARAFHDAGKASKTAWVAARFACGANFSTPADSDPTSPC
jgi:hypothetical protein